MSSKFIPPPDQINTISSKKSKKSFSDLSNQSIFHEMKRNIKESYTTDAFEQVGQLNAIVLEVITEDATRMLWKNPLMSWAYYERNVIPDYVEIRYRVPEIHAHLPEPEHAEDWKAINRHPKAIMKKDKGVPEVGDIVTLDFKDKNNFSGAMVIEGLNSNPGPNPGGSCSPAGTFGSGKPSFNASPPTGDSQSPSPQGYSAKNTPAQESFENGIDYSLPTDNRESVNAEEIIKGYNELKWGIFVISIDEFNNMSDFQNLEKLPQILATKNIFSICFRISEGKRRLQDIVRLTRAINILKSKRYECSLMIDGGFDIDTFMKNFVHLAAVAKATKIDSIIYELTDEKGENYNSADSKFQKKQKTLKNLANGLGINFFCSATEFSNFDLVNGSEWLCDKIFITQNHWDFQDYPKNNLLLPQDSYGDTLFTRVMRSKHSPEIIPAPAYSPFDSSTLSDSQIWPSFWCSGINFLYIDNDGIESCLTGERSANILNNDIRAEIPNTPYSLFGAYDKVLQECGNGTKNLSLIYNYSSIDGNMSDVLTTSATSFLNQGFTEPDKQSFLNSSEDIQKPYKPNVEDIQGTPEIPTIEEPSFPEQRSDTSTPTSTQDAAQAPAPTEAATSPGGQCAPFPGGPSPFGGSNAGAAGGGAPVTPPSYRFDSIENYQNLGWTASAHHIINDVIFDFMQRFSAAVYRRLPANSPSFTGSDPKKIRLTSTMRTAETQVRLMWDKIDKQGDNGVWKVYGDSRAWVRAVVKGYHEKDFATPVAIIQDRIDRGLTSGHSTGRAVDVHTWSHINAEGINSSGASVAKMNSSKFIQAVVAAARECNAKPLVEDYQQHVHITIL